VQNRAALRTPSLVVNAPSLRILLASPDPVQSVMAARLIQRLGYPAAHRVQNWHAAFDAMQEFPADVWLVDAGLLPRGDASPAAVATPPWIIAITAAADDLDGVAHSFNDVLRAPLGLQALSEALLRVRIPNAPPGDFSGTTWSELLRLFGSAGVAELLGALRKDLPVTQERHQQALRSQDFASLQRVAHSLRGASLQLGADDLARLCSRAEQAAREGSGTATELNAQALMRYGALIERLQDELQRL